MDVDVLPEIDVLHLTDLLGTCMLSFLSDLRRCAASDNAGAAELKAKFLESAEAITSCTFDDLDPTDGAFVIKDGVLIFNLQPILQIFQSVLDDVDQQMTAGNVLDHSQIEELQREAFIVYGLHELRHISQGIGLKSSVNAVKHISGLQKVADMDLQADCDAVFAYAMVRGGDKWSSEYFDYYRRALHFSSQYFFKAFDFTLDRIEKFARAVGIILMQARFALLEIEYQNKSLPLDTPIFVNIDRQMNMNIFGRCPDEKLLLTVPANDNKILFKALEQAAYDDALVEGIKLMQRISAAA